MPSTLGAQPKPSSRRKPRLVAHSPRTSVHKGSESVDDYLKAIFSLGGAEGRAVGSSELAERLQVAPASITNMLQKLASAQNPLVEYRRHRGVRLSPAGRRRALEIVRHHRLVETFLHRMLDYDLDELHDEAERLEHFISERFEARIDAKLGHPDRDPHGACIPALDGTMPPGHGVTCNCPE
jgi:DtxR family transcriptional regulator, Mn-dependent transcriptional regulator